MLPVAVVIKIVLGHFRCGALFRLRVLVSRERSGGAACFDELGERDDLLEIP